MQIKNYTPYIFKFYIEEVLAKKQNFCLEFASETVEKISQFHGKPYS